MPQTECENNAETDLPESSPEFGNFGTFLGEDPSHGEVTLGPRLFLLDDDPVFCRLMQKVAKRNGIQLSVCSSLAEFGTDESHRNFDVAVIDFYLEDIKGTEIACLLEDRAVVLVSRTDRCLEEGVPWPECIKKFVPKQLGPEAILEAAVSLLSRA